MSNLMLNFILKNFIVKLFSNFKVVGHEHEPGDVDYTYIDIWIFWAQHAIHLKPSKLMQTRMFMEEFYSHLLLINISA